MFNKSNRKKETFCYNPLRLNDYYQKNNLHQKLLCEYKTNQGGYNP